MSFLAAAGSASFIGLRKPIHLLGSVGVGGPRFGFVYRFPRARSARRAAGEGAFSRRKPLRWAVPLLWLGVSLRVSIRLWRPVFRRDSGWRLSRFLRCVDTSCSLGKIRRSTSILLGTRVVVISCRNSLVRGLIKRY
jgi:hypothetical protein